MTRFIIEWLNLAVRYAIPIVAESLFNLRLAVCCTPLESTVEPCSILVLTGKYIFNSSIIYLLLFPGKGITLYVLKRSTSRP